MDAIDAPRGMVHDILCFAHRGARGHAPENTLAAFALAFDLGADGIECDVQRSRDGALVIIHDGTLERTTSGTGPVAAQTLAHLRALDAGRRWRWPERIPTLEETLALAQARGRQINLEIKGQSEAEALGTAQALAAVLAHLDGTERARVLVSSFTLPAVAALKRELPWLRVAALFGGRRWRHADMVAPARALAAEAIHPAVGLAAPAVIQRAHAAGLRVHIWTANRLRVIAQLMAWGVDGLFTDYPERITIARAHAAAGAPVLAPRRVVGRR